MTRVLLPLLLLLAACEDNEHPFGDSWATSCSAEGMPALEVDFRRQGHLDDSGRRRAYLGRVTLGDPQGFDHIWIWEVAVDEKDDSAQTVTLERVPIPDAYETELQELTLDVDTFVEADDKQSATMTGICGWGDSQGQLTMTQSDDCDICDDINCSTLSFTPVLGVLGWAGVLLLRRRRERRAEPDRD